METIYGVMDTLLPLEAFHFSFMKNALLAVLLLTPLRKCAPWRMMLLHLAGTAALIAVVTAVLCALRPLTLLKEKQDE